MEGEKRSKSLSKLHSIALVLGFTVLIVGGIVLSFYVIRIVDEVSSLKTKLSRLQESKIDTEVCLSFILYHLDLILTPK